MSVDHIILFSKDVVGGVLFFGKRRERQTPLNHTLIGLKFKFTYRCVLKTSQTVWKRSGEWHVTVSDPGERSPFPGAA